MQFNLFAAALLALSTITLTTAVDNGHATRYWDCCRISESYSNKAAGGYKKGPAKTCLKDGVTPNTNPNAVSGCNGGNAFACNDMQPWVSTQHSNIAYTFSSRNATDEAAYACSCYEVKLANGKTMVTQVTNVGYDVGSNQFDVAIPGGGVGAFNGCTAQWNAPKDGWGARTGGIQNAAECGQLPSQLQAGCRFRFSWFTPTSSSDSNPQITSHRRIRCPAALTDKSGCIRNDDTKYPVVY